MQSIQGFKGLQKSIAKFWHWQLIKHKAENKLDIVKNCIFAHLEI